MSTFQISAPLTAPADTRRAGPVLRAVLVVIDAMAQTNRRRAEREIARVAQRYGIATDRA